MGMQEAKHRHVGKLEQPLAQAGAVARARRAEFGDMAECVGAEIAIVGGVRRAADAKGIQDEEKCPGQRMLRYPA